MNNPTSGPVVQYGQLLPTHMSALPLTVSYWADMDSKTRGSSSFCKVAEALKDVLLHSLPPSLSLAQHISPARVCIPDPSLKKPNNKGQE